MRKTVLCALFAALIVVASTPPAPKASAASEAAPSKILTLAPATTKPTVKPGASAQGKFQIINQGTSDYPVHIYSAPYSVHSEDYTPDFTPVSGKLNAASWIQFDTTTATIPPAHTLDVPYTITIPSGTAPGGYYAVAFAETHSQPSNKQGVVVNERVGEIFYIQVAGTVKQTGKLLSWSSKFIQQAPLSATLRLENDGNLDYASDIHVTVRDMFGRPKYSLNTTKEVLPQTVRRIPINWTTTPSLGLFKVTGTVSLPNNTTQALTTKYVLVISPVLRIIATVLVAVPLAYSIGRQLGKRKRQAKKSTE
ncbi:MAG TPA: hypothetical protein VLG92_02760 [Candidatus Saccharimonadia bacterium]|nr:hypothetical protein [Candidatus Saccharimonadia bacterium]